MEDFVVPTDKSLKSYWFFFSGQLISLFGSSIVQFAIFWWLAITAKTDPAYEDRAGTILGIASVAAFAPFIITNLFSGVLIDRWNRKKVIAIADGFQAFITTILLVIFYFDLENLFIVLVILALRSVTQGFHSPATQAIIPLMVPKDKLTRVNSFENIFNSSVFLIGPILGALLVEIVGIENIGSILWIDIFTFLIAIIPVILITIPDITKKKREEGKGNFKSEFKEGIVFITNQKGLLSLLITFTVINIMTAPIDVLLPIIIIDKQLLNGNATTLALYFATTQAGVIIGASILTRGKLFLTNAKGVAFGQSLIYISMFLVILSIILTNHYLLYFAGFGMGAGMSMANIPSQTIWQSVVPAELQGRVMSVRSVIAWTMIPVSFFVGGVLSDIIGPVNLFSGSLLVGIIFLTYAWFMTGFPIVEDTITLNSEGIEEPLTDYTGDQPTSIQSID